MVVKFIGLVLAVVGVGLILAAVGVNFLGVGLAPVWLEVVVGFVLLGAGIYIIRGGTVTL